MWEFSLYFEKPLLPYFNDLKTELKQQFCNNTNCVAIGIKDEQYCFMIALQNQVFKQNETKIKQKLAEIICVYYKPYYILKSLKNFDLTCDDNIILLDILASYENQQDIFDISKKLNVANKLYLKSYISFKLKEQINKWQEIGELINENSLFLIDKTIRQELIKFLMAGLQSDAELLTIKKNGGCFCVIDSNKRDVALKSIFYAQNEYDNLLYAIINKFPKYIQIENSKDFDVKFLNNLYQLFGENVKLLKW